MEENKCVHRIQHSARNIGKTYVSRCGKKSKFNDEHGRELCEKHFKRWFFKKYKQKYEEFISE